MIKGVEPIIGEEFSEFVNRGINIAKLTNEVLFVKFNNVPFHISKNSDEETLLKYYYSLLMMA